MKTIKIMIMGYFIFLFYRSCFQMKNPIKKKHERLIGDDGCIYDREIHTLSPDLYTIKGYLNGRDQNFVYNRKPHSYTGSVYQISTSKDVAQIESKVKT